MSQPSLVPVEWMQAKFHVADLRAVRTEAEVLAAVEKAEGVQSATIAGEELHVVYDPVRTSERELEAKVRGTGHAVTEGETERESPLQN